MSDNLADALAVVIAVCALLLSGFAADRIFGDEIATRDDLWVAQFWLALMANLP